MAIKSRGGRYMSLLLANRGLLDIKIFRGYVDWVLTNATDTSHDIIATQSSGFAISHQLYTGDFILDFQDNSQAPNPGLYRMIFLISL